MAVALIIFIGKVNDCISVANACGCTSFAYIPKDNGHCFCSSVLRTERLSFLKQFSGSEHSSVSPLNIVLSAFVTDDVAFEACVYGMMKKYVYQ
ncbi:MAG: hypothetical protein HFE39_11010 [Clostridiales bacterium]|jgi:predicted nucleic acid-binding Zn finger protein|nr:hypothetical protein [Clostridiales bacterium]